MKALYVFVAMCIVDWVWAKYTFAMTSKKVLLSGWYGMLIILLSGTAIISYTADPWMLLPAAAGAFVGTVIAVGRERDRYVEK